MDPLRTNGLAASDGETSVESQRFESRGFIAVTTQQQKYITNIPMIIIFTIRKLPSLAERNGLALRRLQSLHPVESIANSD